MDWLARREYSRVELQSRLQRAGFADSEICDALDSLLEDGLQSDQRFTASFLRHRVSQGYGPRRVRAELASRGVDASMVDHHLEEFDGNWFDVAESAWRRRFGETPIESLKDRGKRYRYLSNRGFSHEQIQHAAAVCPQDDQKKDDQEK